MVPLTTGQEGLGHLRSEPLEHRPIPGEAAGREDDGIRQHLSGLAVMVDEHACHARAVVEDPLDVGADDEARAEPPCGREEGAQHRRRVGRV